MNFQDLGLMRSILTSLQAQGYTQPTPIQEQAIPAALAGRDVLGCARTGTGKTCAFAAPILQRLSASPTEGRPIRALILTPTRELAIQIQDCFEAYGENLPLKSVVIFGGVGQNPQVQAIQSGCDILVATPGRLKDLHNQGFIHLEELEIFVLDEADRMLDMGFIHDVKQILAWLPTEKQTLFFSATMPKEITQLVDSLLHNPVKIAVDPVSSPVEVIDQSVYLVDKGNKTKLLVQLLREKQIPSALVFTRTKHGANRVAQDLSKAGITAAAIHGNKSQTARQAALAGFKDGSIQVMVATDIAARGLDIEDLTCVFNYNLPEVPETYIHRIGRTGRAGKDGMAISFCDFAEKDLLRDIEKLIGKPVPRVEDHPFPMQVFELPVKDKRGRVINAEDAEARAAAKARRSQAQAKKPAARKEDTVMDQPKRKKAAVKAVPASEAKAAPKKEKVKAKPVKVNLPKEEQEDIELDFSSIRLPGERKYKRPERKPMSALDEIAPVLPESERPVSRYGAKRTGHLQNTFFTPEEQKVYGGEPEPLMDATARLFATKKPAVRRHEEESLREDRPSRGHRRKPAKESASKAAPAEKRAAPKSGKKAPAKVKKDRGSTPLASEAPRKAKAPGKNSRKKSAGADQRLVSPAPQKKGGRPGRPPRPMPSIYSAHKKDSTEQESLMKPFYLSDD